MTTGWDSPNVPYAIGISLGSGLATGIGGAFVFFPAFLSKVSPSTILGVSLALSAGVMLYVSFIEIFAKSYAAIESSPGISEGAATAITTVCFFAGMGICVLLELFVGWLNKRAGLKHEDQCAAHMDPNSIMDLNGKHGPCCDDGDCPKKVPEAIEISVMSLDATATSSTADKAEPTSEAAAGMDLNNPAEKASLARMGAMTACAIAIHNFPEGLATFLATVSDTKVGASLGVAIAVHNIPEGLCVAMPIFYATGSKWKAFCWSVLSGVSEPIGGILGFAVLQPFFTDLVFGIVFSMVGGMMIFIVCHELLPAAHRYMDNRAKTTAWFCTGMAIMALSLVLFVV